MFPLGAMTWMVVIGVVYFSAAGAAGLDPQLQTTSPGTFSVEALWLNMVRSACAVAIFTAAWGYGRWALISSPLEARLRRHPVRALDRFLAEIGLGLGTLSLLALALAAAHLLRGSALAVILAVGVTLAALGRPWRGLREFSAVARPAGRIPYAVLAFLTAVGIFGLVGALAPEVEYDAVWYHLEFPYRHVSAGTIVDDVCQPVSPYPWGAELLFTYALAINGPITAKLVHFGFGILAALTVYSLGTRFVGSVAGRRAGLYAAATFAATPTVLWEATTAYIDLATTLFVVLALMWVLEYVQHRSLSDLGIAGLFLGFALSTKHLALLAAVPLALIVLWSSRDRGAVRRVVPVAVLTTVALVPVLPWYIRAQVQAGNPFFPTLYHVFGGDPRRWTAQSDAGLEQFTAGFGLGHGPLALLQLPWTTTMHGAAFGGSLGVAYLMFVPLAFHRRMPQPLMIIGAFSLGYVALWASPISSQQLRFLVPVLAPLAVLAGYGVDRALSVARRWSPAAAVAAGLLVTAVFLLSLPPFLRAHERDRAGDGGWLTHVLREVPVSVVTGAESDTAYLQRRIPTYSAVRRLNEVAAADDTVVIATDPFVDFYAEPRTIPDYAVCLSRLGLGRGGGDDLRALRRASVDYLLVQDGLRDASVVRWHDADVAEYLQPIYADGRATLYRVRPSPAG
jgi:hypothetical protein